MYITKFNITNYRSLKNFSVDRFDHTTIFYGDNNVGKSNILHALHVLFQRKRKLNKETIPFKLTEPQNFYEGVIENFNNSFFGNIPTEIDFQVEFTISAEELSLEKPLAQKLIKKTGTDRTIVFRGNIVPIDSTKDWAEMLLGSVQLNSQLIYQFDRKQNIYSYFPTVDKKRKNQPNLAKSFSHLVEPFNDCVTLVESARDMHPADFSQEPVKVIDSVSFKNFLYSLYLGEDDHKTFEQINSVFSREPFSFGNISFGKVNGKLEVMIKENDLRLPIKHIGSGVLQTLYIIATTIQSKSKIVCIEELEQNLAPRRQYLTLSKLQSMIGDKSIGNLQQIILSSHSSVYAKPKLGTIYLLEKKDGLTGVKEVLDKKLKKDLKKHFIDAALPPNTYTNQEWEQNISELKQITESGFRR